MLRESKKPGRGTVPLFRVAGIQVSLDYSWFIIFALITWSLSAGYFPRHFRGLGQTIYWTVGTVTSVLFFLSIVLHEIMHSLVAMRFGIAIRSITLFIFGGASHLSREAKSPWSEFIIAFAGPATNIVLGLVLLGIKIRIPWESAPIVAAVFNYLAWINILIGLFNLVPAFPLDGGRMLRAVAWWKTGSPSYAIRLSTDMGKGFSLAIISIGALEVFTGSLLEGLLVILIGLFLRSMAYAGMEGFMLSHELENMKVRNIMIRDWVGVPPGLSVERLVADYILNSTMREFTVESDEKLLGTVSLENILALTKEERKRSAVRDIMVPVNSESEISPDDSLSEALRLMISSNIIHLLVMENGRMVGMVTRKGVIRLMELRKR
jgi:Zn-dependent protease/predicted transcriptional regulator